MQDCAQKLLAPARLRQFVAFQDPSALAKIAAEYATKANLRKARISVSMTDDIAALFRVSHARLVQRLTPLVSCRELARDIVAESFVILVRERLSQPIVRPLGFLYRTAVRLALDQLKHRRVAARYAQAMATEAHYEHRSPEQLVDWQQRVALFQSALSELRPPTDEVFCW